MEPVTQAQFYDRMDTLEEKFELRHKSLRDTINDNADRLCAKVDAHAKEMGAVRDRVFKMEIEREQERLQIARDERAVARKISITSILSGGGVVVLLKAFDWLRGH